MQENNQEVTNVISLITKTRLFKYIENFTTKIMKTFEMKTNEKWKKKMKKNLVGFRFLLKNIDCGYSLEPPRRGGSNEYHNLCFRAEIRKLMYTPINPSFTV